MISHEKYELNVTDDAQNFLLLQAGSVGNIFSIHIHPERSEQSTHRGDERAELREQQPALRS